VYSFFFWTQENDDVNFEAFCNSLSWETHADAMAATLIVPANTMRSNNNCSILIDPSNHSSCDDDDERHQLHQLLRSGTTGDNTSIRRTSPSYDASPFPKLEQWIIDTLGRREGRIGSIGTWSVVGGTQRLLPQTVCFNMKDNRYCDNVGRAHKSNNIIWNIDLLDRVCYQSCHDPECRGYRGDPIDVPWDVNDEIDDYFLDYELSLLNENDVVEKEVIRHGTATVVGGTGEFDDSFLEAAMGQLDLNRICNEQANAKKKPSSIASRVDENINPSIKSANTSVESASGGSNDASSTTTEFNNLDLELAKLDLSDIITTLK